MNSKSKGKRGELELASKLRYYGFDGVHRSVQYNGKAEEGQPDLVGLTGIHIECKRVERLNVQEAMEQAVRDSKAMDLPFHDYDMPAVFHRKNDSEWLVTMRLEDWVHLYREYVAGGVNG